MWFVGVMDIFVLLSRSLLLLRAVASKGLAALAFSTEQQPSGREHLIRVQHTGSSRINNRVRRNQVNSSGSRLRQRCRHLILHSLNRQTGRFFDGIPGYSPPIIPNTEASTHSDLQNYHRLGYRHFSYQTLRLTQVLATSITIPAKLPNKMPPFYLKQFRDAVNPRKGSGKIYIPTSPGR